VGVTRNRDRLRAAFLAGEIGYSPLVPVETAGAVSDDERHRFDRENLGR
jgi:hypothetical protein